MQNIKFIDNQWITQCMVQMWFKLSGIELTPAGERQCLPGLF